MTDAQSTNANTDLVIPAELMGKMALSLSTPNSFVLVRNAVERFNKASGGNADPISIAETLIKKGYNIASIPERKVEIRPTPEGLILDVKQIAQLLNENRLSEFPLLKIAVGTVRYMSVASRGKLKGAIESIARMLTRGWYGDDKEQKDPQIVIDGFVQGEAISRMRYGDDEAFSGAPREEQERLAQFVVQQAKFLVENFEDADQLMTKAERLQHERRHEIAADEDRKAREEKRQALFASAEAAERWLFGVARGAYRDAKENVENAAQDLVKSKRAQELIVHHSIDLFDLVDRQLTALENERDRRREMYRIEAPLAVLLTAFAKTRVTDNSPPTIRKDPGGYMYRTLSQWLDAKFVKELPDGAYADVLRNEREYQDKYRARTSDIMRRDSFSMFGRESDSFLEGMDREEKARNEGEMRGYESSRVATLWWKCPLWLQQKILRPYITEELRRVGTHVRGFSGRQFLAYVDDLIAKQNRAIQLQNTLLGTFETGDQNALDQYWKEIMETGAPTALSLLEARIAAEATPTQDRAEAIIEESRKRIRGLQEMREMVNLDFVMSRAEREAEIERRQRERSRWVIPRFRW